MFTRMKEDHKTFQSMRHEFASILSKMDPLFLTGGGSLSCKVHPVVLFEILDHFGRRNEGQKRVIGTLLGVVNNNTIEIRNSFPVPHSETSDNVAVDQEYHKTMLDLHQKVNASEVIVGWYATGDSITDHSVLIHEFYGRETSNPVHLLIDTALKTGSLTTKAFVSSSLSSAITEKQWGSQFQQIKLDFKTFEAEKVGLDSLLQRKDVTVENPEAKLSTDLDSLEHGLERLSKMLAVCQEYVQKVVSKSEKPDNAIGRFLENALSVIPKISPDQFEKLFTGSLQDTLMVVYLANLTRTLSDRLQNVV